MEMTAFSRVFLGSGPAPQVTGGKVSTGGDSANVYWANAGSRTPGPAPLPPPQAS